MKRISRFLLNKKNCFSLYKTEDILLKNKKFDQFKL